MYRSNRKAVIFGRFQQITAELRNRFQLTPDVAENAVMSTSKRMYAAGTPIALLIVILAILATVIWMRDASMDRNDTDLIGVSRQQLESRYGRAMFTARTWELGTRESVRTGGLSMKHTQLTLHTLKPGKGLGSSPAHRVLIWADDDTVIEFAEKVTRGAMKMYDFPMGVAVNNPGRVRLVELNERAKVSNVHEIRPAFVVADPE